MIFIQLACNEADMFESSSILIYLVQIQSAYTQRDGGTLKIIVKKTERCFRVMGLLADLIGMVD